MRKTHEQKPADQSYSYDDDISETIPQQTVAPHEMTSMSNTLTAVSSSAPPIERRSRYGRLIRPPVRYGDEM